jgi:hypothetical protein
MTVLLATTLKLIIAKYLSCDASKSSSVGYTKMFYLIKCDQSWTFRCGYAIVEFLVFPQSLPVLSWFWGSLFCLVPGPVLLTKFFLLHATLARRIALIPAMANSLRGPQFSSVRIFLKIFLLRRATAA